jgi:hypothetical protein
MVQDGQETVDVVQPPPPVVVLLSNTQDENGNPAMEIQEKEVAAEAPANSQPDSLPAETTFIDFVSEEEEAMDGQGTSEETAPGESQPGSTMASDVTMI